MIVCRAILFFGLLVSGVAVADESRDVLAVALGEIEAFGGPITTIVLSPGLPQTLRQSAAQLRATVEQSNLTPALDEQLPNTYFRLGSIDIKDDVATVSGDIGAVLRPDPENMFGCGVGYTVKLGQNADGAWIPNDIFSITC